MIYESMYNKLIEFKKNYYQKRTAEIEDFLIGNTVFKKKRTKKSWLFFIFSVLFSTAPVWMYMFMLVGVSLDTCLGVGMSLLLLLLAVNLINDFCTFYYIYHFLFFNRAKNGLEKKLLNFIKTNDLSKTPIKNYFWKGSYNMDEDLFFNNYDNVTNNLDIYLTQADVKNLLSQLTKEEVTKVIDILKTYLSCQKADEKRDVHIDSRLLEDMINLCESEINFSCSLKDVTQGTMFDDVMLAIAEDLKTDVKNQELKNNLLLKNYL